MIPIMIQRMLIIGWVAKHPLPWRLEQDWGMDVVDADGKTVFGCLMASDAEDLVKFVETVMADEARADELYQKFLREEGIEP